MPAQTFKLDGDDAKYLQGRKSMKFVAEDVANGVQLGCPEICVVPYIGRDDCSESIFTPWGGGSLASFELGYNAPFAFHSGVESIVTEVEWAPSQFLATAPWEDYISPATGNEASIGFGGVGEISGAGQPVAGCNRCYSKSAIVRIGPPGVINVSRTQRVCYIADSSRVSSVFFSDGIVISWKSGFSTRSWIDLTISGGSAVALGANPLTSYTCTVYPVYRQYSFFGNPSNGFYENLDPALVADVPTSATITLRSNP
jgi:hypothetical protein